MPDLMTNTPVVVAIASHDPTGGSGISADIETLSSLGCHCCPVISRLSVQDTNGLIDYQATDTGLLIEQVRAILEDVTVNLFKISKPASLGNIEAIHTILNDYPDIPMVLHLDATEPDSPEYNAEDLGPAICDLLLAQANITLLRRDTALALAPGADNLSACAQQLMEYGNNHLLITASHDDINQVHNQWFSPHSNSQQYRWDRLANSYHGAGDTLSAALAAYLAHGLSMAESIQQAQQFTWQALQKGRRIGMGKLLPDRMHWCRK
jgi:hydroxymethylpyrimidine/phosphomethylpyrimidine kinase